MAKQLSFSNESREALEKGVNFVANAVKVTIGPKAKNVVIEKKFGSPDIVRDGSTVAKEIEIENPISNLGAKLICLLYTSPSPRDRYGSRMPSSA